MKDRFDARSAMIWRVSLSAGARLLYVALDDMARDRGDWFIRQADLATKLGVSRRELQSQLYELRDAGHIRVAGTGRSSRYFLSWTSANPVDNTSMVRSPVRSSYAAQCAAGAQPGAQHHLIVFTGTNNQGQTTVRCACGNYLEPNPEEGIRCNCGHGHYPGCERCTLVQDRLEETRGLLAGYVRQCRLPWAPPDDTICAQVLDLAGGLGELYAGLRDLMLNQRVAPGRSYGWFATVFAKRRTG